MKSTSSMFSHNKIMLQVGTALAVDLTAEEEFCSSAALQVAVNHKGRVSAATQQGSSGINPGILQVSDPPLFTSLQ